MAVHPLPVQCSCTPSARRAPLLWLAKQAGKAGYVEHCTVVRMDDKGKLTTELSGPGTALMELDQALHRGIGVVAAVVTTWLATRSSAGE